MCMRIKQLKPDRKRTLRYFLAVAAAAYACGQSAFAACPMAGVRAVAFAGIVDGDTIQIASAEEADLDGVLAPGSGGEADSESSSRHGARDALRALIAGHALAIAFAGPERDRYGRLRVQLFADGTWVQGSLLEQGLARAEIRPGTRACAAALLAAEARGRDAGHGHWADGPFAVRGPEELAGHIGTFQIVEGTIVGAALRRGRLYLNFGSDWRTDFTVTVAPEDMRLFRREKIDWKSYKGRRVRVRGWVESYYGPQIGVAHPDEIEMLD